MYIIYLLSSLIVLIYGKESKLTVDIEYGLNNTFILNYNLTTNYSYYLTFRLYEQKQQKFGLFSPTYQYKKNSIRISNQYNSSSDRSNLFIICFYFLRQLNDIDIQCKDIRLLKLNQLKSSNEYLPTYKPLFVPMMYILIVFMLLPVMLQHHHFKKMQKLERQKQIRRLSLSLNPEDRNLLPRNLSLKPIPIQIELVSLPSAQTILDIIDDNDVTFTLQKLQPLIENYNQEESNISADDCIAHLLDSTPWKTSSIYHPPMISSISNDLFAEQHFPIMTKFYGNNDDDDRRSSLKLSPHYKLNVYNTNPTFIESDV